MRLAILGGGGFRVPLVYAALADGGPFAGLIREVTLYDTDKRRLDVIGSVLAAMPPGPRLVPTTDLDEALTGADFVFSAIRVGGTAGRVADERVPLREGVLGQETVGAGGVLYALRTLPVMTQIARRVREVAPDARVVNFTNPAGMVTEAMAAVLGDRVVGICDSPLGVVRRAARAAGVDPDAVDYDYLGLNHLGWLRSLRIGDRELLPGLLASPRALASFEEGRLFGPRLLGALGMLPNEYLHYYYFRRETLAAAREAEETRGEFLDRQQTEFYSLAEERPAEAYRLWRQARLRREETYLAEARSAGGGWQRDSCDLDGGGYERVALALMAALSGATGRQRFVLNVRNNGTLPALPADAVVETVCEVDGDGVRSVPVTPLDGAELGLVLQVKAVERATIEAAATGSHRAALRALLLHPLVDSPEVAARVLDAARPAVLEGAPGTASARGG
ncbi:6-phospho-beta-glucosidase [Streptomyces alkaliterrae]|uniref:6-phospho-beta-glucosidase n=1 Tax=Streptomyces alkaliterrae TaxID=2213162 RepID=A0A5P0YJ91_9ACTN|nr:6-phospho-beta-glucosidase [Streptomyces alkaliterrae]MBB1251998.1 6-phospho-beta-glucosidase [Streptomyces alkaliterrae]MBB1257497.1 6-phospho-beta-glucosidase [Streptomyces alkaliterrae]MQS00385.1 6-phospho-beta-glucosidase [Streptomyces alkaliterrae]